MNPGLLISLAALYSTGPVHDRFVLAAQCEPPGVREHRSGEKAARELPGYAWDPAASDKGEDHGVDALRYDPGLTHRQPTTCSVTGRHRTPETITQRTPGECLRRWCSADQSVRSWPGA
jgi:hypothetical protein